MFGVYIKDWGRGEYKWFMDLGLGWDWILTALSDDTEAVILEVSEAVSTALDEFLSGYCCPFTLVWVGEILRIGFPPAEEVRLARAFNGTVFSMSAVPGRGLAVTFGFGGRGAASAFCRDWRSSCRRSR